MQTGRRELAGPSDAAAILGSNQAAMRAHNERLVLTLIRQNGPTAKVDIARATGLSAQTVSVIMRALEADGLLLRGTPVRGRVGQPSVPMALAPEGAFFLGLMVGRRTLELVVTDFIGNVISRLRQTHTHPTPKDTLRFTFDGIKTLTEALPPAHQERIGGLGVAMPYQLWDWAETLGVPQAEMDAWRTVDLHAELSAHTRLPVFVRNDASSACAAELVFGKSEAPRNFLHFFIAYFIGGGVVLNGRLYTGPSGNAGALGSTPVPGPDAGQSRQLIDVASLSGLANRYMAAGYPGRGMWATADELPMHEDILGSWVEDASAGIAYAITSAVSVVDFEAVLIDGWIPTSLRERLVAGIAARMESMNTAGLTMPLIREGTIGPDARALGAASLPLSERFLVEPSS